MVWQIRLARKRFFAEECLAERWAPELGLVREASNVVMPNGDILTAEGQVPTGCASIIF